MYSINNLGIVLDNQGKYKEAEKLHRRALSSREKALGKEHPDTFGSVWNLAYSFHIQVRYQNALPVYQKACVAFEKALGSDPPHTLNCANNYCRMLDEMRRDSKTENENTVGEDP